LTGEISLTTEKNGSKKKRGVLSMRTFGKTTKLQKRGVVMGTKEAFRKSAIHAVRSVSGLMKPGKTASIYSTLDEEVLPSRSFITGGTLKSSTETRTTRSHTPQRKRRAPCGKFLLKSPTRGPLKPLQLEAICINN